MFWENFSFNLKVVFPIKRYLFTQKNSTTENLKKLMDDKDAQFLKRQEWKYNEMGHNINFFCLFLQDQGII